MTAEIPSSPANRRNEPHSSREPGSPKRSAFTRFSQAVASYAGKPATFVGAVAIILAWGLSGPLFGFNDTWQLVINTSTTIITFLMVFVIQNSQNRDTAAMQIKLDELISKLEGPREILLDLEELDETELEKLRAEFEAIARRARDGRPSQAAPG
ncbi:low affinity iron permease family protein [Ancylobacter terrae]|uniref:low affinity iron permease family protein n=1 Tax=Ancylobacter sp. sgz301288 TaxID=3342077 RepID=UPI0038591A5C